MRANSTEMPAANDAANPFATEPNTAFFWSGRTGASGGPERAAEIAAAANGKTLEMTLVERGISIPVYDGSSKAIAAWDHASARFAEAASGTVRAVLGERVRDDSFWTKTELPRLMQNERVTSIIAIDPATLKETVLFDRAAELARSRSTTRPDGAARDTDRHASQAFMNEPQERALKQHPTLASAYAAITAIEKHAVASGLSDEQQSKVLGAARENIAKSIQQGQYPDIKIRETKEATSELAHER